MANYLNDKRDCPHTHSATETELSLDIAAKKCKTCNHYTFYYCKQLKCTCGPEGACIKNESYKPRANLREMAA